MSMDDFGFCSRIKRYRKKKDKFKNTILEFLVREKNQEKEMIFLNVDGATPDPQFDVKRQSGKLVKKLAREGFFNGCFKTREVKNAEINGKLPKDYQVDFIIPPAVGGTYSPENLYVTSKEVATLMYDLYWRQILLELKAFQYKGDGHRFGIIMPKVPRFFSNLDFLDFVLPEEKRTIAEYLARKAQWRREAIRQISCEDKKDYLMLALGKVIRPPEGMKMAFVKVHAVPMDKRAQVRQEYLRTRPDIVRASLVRGDFESMSEDVKEMIAATGHIPESEGLTCHHIIPRSLGGENDMDNIFWLEKNAHLSLHRIYIDPLVDYLDGLVGEKRPIFFQMPVPESTKIPLYVQTKRKTFIPQDRAPSFIRKKIILAKKKGKLNDGRRV